MWLLCRLIQFFLSIYRCFHSSFKLNISIKSNLKNISICYNIHAKIMIQITLLTCIPCVNLFLTYDASKSDTRDDSISLEYIISSCMPYYTTQIDLHHSDAFGIQSRLLPYSSFFQTMYFLAILLASIYFSLKFIGDLMFQIYITHIFYFIVLLFCYWEIVFYLSETNFLLPITVSFYLIPSKYVDI